MRTVRVRQLRRIGCLLVVQSASIEAAPRIAGEGTRSDQDVDETSTLATSFAPSDDLNQPLDKQAAGKFDDFTGRLLVRVADADAKPAWKPASFFKRYAGK